MKGRRPPFQDKDAGARHAAQASVARNKRLRRGQPAEPAPSAGDAPNTTGVVPAAAVTGETGGGAFSADATVRSAADNIGTGGRERLSPPLRPFPIQTFLVTTPLGVADATIISLTLRFPNALHNLLGEVVPDLIAAGFDGWTAQPLASGPALLDRLAEYHDQGNPDLRAAIIDALDERAAVLRFSNPQPLRTEDLKQLCQGLYGFARSPRKLFVGALTLGACLILVQLSEGTAIAARYAVIEIGEALVDRITASIRSEAIPRDLSANAPGE